MVILSPFGRSEAVPVQKTARRRLSIVANRTVERVEKIRSTSFFEELRALIKERGRRADVAVLIAWLLANFLDDGAIRSPQMPRRRTIDIDGVRYWLVRVSSFEKTPPQAS